MLERDAADPARGLVWVVQDITARKEAEEALEARGRDLEAARDKADRASRSKSEFLANMSHEVRTPINAITGFTALALRTNPSPLQKEYLDKIQGAAQGLLRIVNDLLDFSKIEAGHLSLESIPFELTEVVSAVWEFVSVPAAEKGLRVTVEVAPDVPVQVVGDPLRLGQVLMNLGSNAVKFTERGTVALTVETDVLLDTSVRLRFAVTDTGIGLQPEQVGRLFQAFTQADTSTTRRFGGTGLGLVICQRLVEMMNGRIWLESEAGVGTTFFVVAELGLVQAGAMVTRADAPALFGERRLAGARLLVAEDNAINQQIARELLAHEGAEVEIADNGLRAVAAVTARGTSWFDAVLVDLQMPVMDGYEATRRIRELEGSARLPILALTAHAMVEERERCLAAGMQDHIAKPIDPDVMVAKIARCIGPERLAAAGSRAAVSVPVTAPAGDALPLELPGVDVAAGRRRFQGREAVYLRLLRQFHRDYDGFGFDLADPACVRHVHALRGVAANLGLAGVAARAGDLERALVGGGAAEAIRDRLAAALREVLAGLAPYAAADDVQAAAKSAGEWDLGAALPLVRELALCLQRNDLRATELVSELQAQLGGSAPPWLGTVAGAVDGLDFPVALQALRAQRELAAAFG